MRVAQIFESSGDIIGAIFAYRQVILSRDRVAAPFAKERVEALAQNASPAAGFHKVIEAAPSSRVQTPKSKKP